MRHTVYFYRRDLNETRVCDLGRKHSVTFHEVKFLTQTGTRQEFIKALNYTHDGWGTVRIAVDAQDRVYESKPTWDGYGPWVRFTDGKVFFDRPVIRGDATFTLDGKRIK